MTLIKGATAIHCQGGGYNYLQYSVPCLSHSVHTSNGLLLSTDVQQGLNKQHVRCLDDVEPFGARVKWKKQNIHISTRLELCQVGLELLVVRHKNSIFNVVVFQGTTNELQDLLPLQGDRVMVVSCDYHVVGLTDEKTSALAPGSLSLMLISVLTTAMILAEWLPCVSVG